jgi:hypothetical protein
MMLVSFDYYAFVLVHLAISRRSIIRRMSASKKDGVRNIEILTRDFADNADFKQEATERAGRSTWQKNGGRKMGNSDERNICAGRGNLEG